MKRIHINALALAGALLVSVLTISGATAQTAPTVRTQAQASPQAVSNDDVTADLNADGHTNVLAARLRRPESDTLGRAHIGLFIMHPYSSYQNSALCDGLAQRGFTVLCADSVFTGNLDGYYGYEQHAPGIRAGINYLRSLSGVTRVLLVGHSMGAPMMAFYQNVAENGAATACQGAEKILPCVDTNLHHLPRADGVVLFDPHLGDGLATFTYVDPALGTATTQCPARQKQYDMFDPANGYVSDPGGLDDNSATYTKQFRKTFLLHQARRNEALMKDALRLLKQRRRETGNPNDMGDDIPFDVPGATGARLWQPDTSLMRSTQQPHILLARDGSRPTTVIRSVRPPSGNPDSTSCADSTLKTNVHIWLGAKALRANPGTYDQSENDINGVDYASSETSTASNVRGIGKHPADGQSTTPLLVIANTGHYFLRPAEIVYNNAASTDKTVAYSEGAVHGGTPCAQCTRILLGDPSLSTAAANAYWTDPDGNGPLERTMNYMAEWLSTRY